MTVKSRITVIAREMLGLHIRRNSSSWLEISALCRVHGEEQVIEAFKDWVRSQSGELVLSFDHFGDFIRVADGLLKHEFSLETSHETTKK